MSEYWIRLFSLIFLLSFWACANAQESRAGITGQITDNKGKPIDLALVLLLTTDSNTSVAQSISDEKGHFFFPCVNKNVKLMITYLGYLPYLSEIFNAQMPKDFKTIILTEEIEGLDEIVVIGAKKKPIVEQKAGKLVFNVENSINAQGSNAFDVLRQAPGVMINDGSKTISINGRNNTLVMINGKQTYMPQADLVSLLKSTPSSQIKSIEVMSNATAQYDAAGTGGVLNLIMKKNNAESYNMTINAGASYWLNLKQNMEISFNYNRKKINVYGNYSHNFGHTGLFYGGKRKQSGNLFITDSDDTDKRNTIASALGVDYSISDNHQIGFQVSGNFIFGPGVIKTTNTAYDAIENGNLLYSIYSESDYYHQVANRYNFNVNYKYESSEKNTFMLDFDYGLFKGNSKNNQPNTYYSSQNKVDSILNFHSAGRRNIFLYAATSSYKQKLGSGMFTGGVKFSNVTSKNDYDFYNVKNNINIVDLNASNDFDYTEAIFSTYAMYDLNLLDKWQFNIGARLEHTHSEGNFMPLAGSDNKENLVKKDYTDLFPSIGVTYKIKGNNRFSISYGKRIDRPVYSDLNPIEQPLDGLSSWKGNPFLSPQKTHRTEIQYQYKKTSLGLSYSITDDYKVGITDTLGNDKIIMIPLNVGTQIYYGINLSQSLSVYKGWELNLSSRVYHLQNKVSFDEQRLYDRTRWAYGFSLQSTFPLFFGIRSELLAVYSSKRLGGSTDIMGANGLINIGFQKKYFKNKMIIKLSLSDLFWTSNWDSVNQFGDFESVSYGYGETRLLKLNITFKIGSNKDNYHKKSNVESETGRF